MFRVIRLSFILGVVLLIQSCSFGIQQINDLSPTRFAPDVTVSVAAVTITPFPEYSNFASPTLAPVSLFEPTLDVSALPQDFWMDLPVIPDDISDHVREIYERGLLMGNNPNAFSKVGDCHSTNPYFLADYDKGSGAYNLGEYSDLQLTIDYFSGSFGRASLAAKQGLSTAGVLASLWSDWKQCDSNETPLDCEFRLNHPSFAIISLGTNEAYDVKLDKTPFEGRLRRIIEHSIDQGVVPILSTKADNDEGDYYINYVTAKLAVEYDLPFWNFWRAVQTISNYGMRSADHLTFAPTNSFSDFSKREYLDYGMQVRNLTALQMLDMIRREINQTQVSVTATPVPQSTPEPEVVHQADETRTSPKDGMTLIYISSSMFSMGSNSGNEDEAPVHNVLLSSYWMDATEVTNQMYAGFLNEVGNQIEGGVTWLNPNDPLTWIAEKEGVWQPLNGKDDYPIVGVSWYGARAYCEWAGRDLPTEAQWEFAAKGINNLRFPWGDAHLDCDHSRYSDCENRPVPVGSLTLGASPFGIFDLAGNVSEWVNDRYAADYYQQSPVKDPTGPNNGYYRVIRGGSWGSSYLYLQTYYRDWAGADMRDSDIGFRCVLNP